MTYEIAYGPETIRYEVQWVSTRHTLGIEVHPDQRVIVRAPVGCDEEVISARVKKRAAWISRQIADFQRYSPRTPQRQYVSGETHLYLGRQHRLKVVIGESASVRMNRGQLVVTLREKVDPDRVRMMLHRWYLDRAKQVFGEVLDQCLPRFKGQQRPRLIVRAMKSRWGSLSSSGSMTLNADLVRTPRICVEYVVVHELCHLQHGDHSAQFYKLLDRTLADWKGRKQKLETVLL
ncbi:MAG: SprT family zinc-dependent metalloprotease [Burkholderiales bacterium]